MNKLKINRATSLFIMTHIIVLLIVFILPDIIFSAVFGGKHRGGINIEVYFHTVIYIITFYVNYFILIDKLLFKKKTVAYIVVALLLAVFMVIMTRVPHFIIDLVTKPERIPPKKFDDNFFILGLMTRDFAMTILTIGLSIAVKMSLRWAKIERMNKQIIAEQREMELSNLKNQLNPHFLFNTLNNIYALIAIDQEKAQNAVHQLSKMLRYTLYESEDEVDLEKEFLFMHNFIELMKLRLSSNNKLEVEIYNGPTNNLKIAPLLFISMVENAFKHGVSGSKPSVIRISITLNDTTVSCHVENSYFPKINVDDGGSGIGVVNLKRRLSLLYDTHYEYKSEIIDNKYVSELTINLNHKKPQ